MGEPAGDDFVRWEAESLIATVLGLVAEEVHPAARIREDLGLDSYDLADLVLAMESRFGVHLSDRVFEKVATVADILGAVRRALTAERSPTVSPHRVSHVGRAS
jgi:acyl carrier protein